MTVAPLTATVLADADEGDAGIASGVNNAIARVAGLLATAAIGAIVAAQFSSALDGRLEGVRLDAATSRQVEVARERSLGVTDDPALREATADASESAFALGVGIAAVLVAAGGVLGLAGIRRVPEGGDLDAHDCGGGQLAGAPVAAARRASAAAEA
jgi:hypothetical protein